MSQESSKPDKTPLEVDLMHFDDDFVEFADYCSFMCDAFACLAMREDYLGGNTAGGIIRYSSRIKRRVEVLKEDLGKIYEKAYRIRKIG
ncbi:hypothetical protein [Microbulbifer sp.]|uniref:hypothetical protein n=1 Tax=Microbulbifer sp. TaxID=1908541 RepID=UPI003F36946C